MSEGAGVVLLEQDYSENGLVQVDAAAEMVRENLADEILEDLEEYCEDISYRLTILQLVTDSVIQGMAAAAAERVTAKELEVASLKARLQLWEDATSKHEDMREKENLNALRNLAKEQFEGVKKEVEIARGRDSLKEIVSGFELLMTTVETVCRKVDGVFVMLSSSFSLCESKQDLELLAEVEDVVKQTANRNDREECGDKFLEENDAQLYGIRNMKWIEKLNDISSLGTKLDAILKSLTVPEAELVPHDSDHSRHRATSDHVVPPASPHGENATVGALDADVAESFDFQQLKHMSKEELVNHFSNRIAKMKRDHESALVQKTEEYFRQKRECPKEKGSLMVHRKDDEFDVLKGRISEVISKLEDFLSESERFRGLFTDNFESVGMLKHRVESLLSENRRLRENEVKRLEAQVSAAEAESLEHSSAEENMRRHVESLESAVEDIRIEASLKEDVYICAICALREQIAQARCGSEYSGMELLITRQIYDIFLREAAIPAEESIEDSDIESSIMQEVNGLIFVEALRDTAQQLDNSCWGVLVDEAARIYLEAEVLAKENELRLEVEEKEKLELEILDLSDSFSKERDQLDVVSQEFVSLSEEASRQQTLVAERDKGIESLRSQYSKALEQIEVDKKEMHELNEKLARTKMELREAETERNKASALVQELHDKLILYEARELGVKKEMEMAAEGFFKIFDDFECSVSGAIERNGLRLEDASSHLKALTETANVLRRTGLMYKQNLEVAEVEVDLLGDEVDVQLRLLETIYIALDHYSPVLKYYPGIIETLELVRRELTGESTRQPPSTAKC